MRLSIAVAKMALSGSGRSRMDAFESVPVAQFMTIETEEARIKSRFFCHFKQPSRDRTLALLRSFEHVSAIPENVLAFWSEQLLL
jgi:hypothetical protein